MLLGKNFKATNQKRKKLASARPTNSVQSFDRLSRRGGGGITDDSADFLFQSFLQEAIASSSGMDRDAHSFALSIQHFSLPTTASPIHQGALKNGFGEAVVSVSWRLPVEVSADPQRLWFCSAPSRWSLAPRRWCREVSSGTNSFRKSEPFFFFESAQLELACEANVLLRQILFN